MKSAQTKYTDITGRLVAAGLRPTRQRIMLGKLLWKDHECCHVTAESLHREAKFEGIEVALATVYNTLHQFTSAGLLREIVVEGGCSYFDTNAHPHHHFLNEDTGELIDIAADEVNIASLPTPPHGTQMSSVDVVIRVRSN